MRRKIQTPENTFQRYLLDLGFSPVPKSPEEKAHDYLGYSRKPDGVHPTILCYLRHEDEDRVSLIFHSVSDVDVAQKYHFKATSNELFNKYQFPECIKAYCKAIGLDENKYKA